uniref:Reverse transcriptase Ty1/copia-type domain-containing protein n=1 Tax=Tanacetum cinerariifolium TaxID=118510 RepID=A0A6L2NE79_TANCI|nr:hypothetical protein [Tanacetum cinerariifolium]
MSSKDLPQSCCSPTLHWELHAPKADLSFVGLDNSVFKFKVSETITSVPKIKTNASKTSKDSLEKPKTVRSSAPIIEDWESNIKPSLEKIEFVNARNTTVENENKAEKPRKFSQSPRVNNKGKMTGQKEIRPVWDNIARVNHQNRLTHPNLKKNFVLAAVLTKSGQVPVNTANQSSHRAAASAFQPSAAKTNNFNEKVNTAKVNNVTTAGPKAVVSVTEGNKNNVVKSSACCIWRPKGNLIDHISKDSGSYTLKRFNYVDPQGRLNVSQMCDKKNSVHFIDIECVVLSPDFKLLDESQVLLKVPRNNDMYSFDLKIIVPVGGNQTNGNAGLKSSEDEVAGKKSTEVPRKENEVQDPTKEGDKNDQEKDLRIKKRHLENNLNKNLNDCLVKGKLLTLTVLTDLILLVHQLMIVVGSTYVNLGGSIHVNAATLPNADLYTDPLMPDLEDTVDLQDTGIFSGAYDDEVEGAVADFNNLELTTVMDVKSAFLYDTIEEEVYVYQPLGFEDPHFPNKVYKVEKALYSLHQAPRAWYETLSTYLLENGFRRGIIDKTLFIKKDKGELTFFLGLQVLLKNDGIFISQDKYVADILKKFDFSSVKTASTLIETNKALLKDEEAEDVDVYLYRSMIGSLMYLTTSRPYIMFVVCACAKFQVTSKISHLHVVKKIFRYLKGQPKLGLWYPRDSPFDLEAFSDSVYAGASLDRKSTTRGCQFLRKRLISWQCKKQIVVSNSTTEAEYVAAANCYGHVSWIQNKMLDYGFKFMNIMIYIDNESTICIVKNPVYHSKTKHIKIRHHFIIDSYEKRLIQVIKIHTDHNVADLLTKVKQRSMIGLDVMIQKS